MGYADFIDGLQLRYFKGVELERYAERKRGEVQNELPPARLWEAIIPTLRIADEARERLGSPVTITSAYRSPAYNRAVGGVPKSQHMLNTALDLIPKEATPKELYDVLDNLRIEGFFMGGLGLYKSFVHLDTRGHNATW